MEHRQIRRNSIFPLTVHLDKHRAHLLAARILRPVDCVLMLPYWHRSLVLEALRTRVEFPFSNPVTAKVEASRQATRCVLHPPRPTTLLCLSRTLRVRDFSTHRVVVSHRHQHNRRHATHTAIPISETFKRTLFSFSHARPTPAKLVTNLQCILRLIVAIHADFPPFQLPFVLPAWIELRFLCYCFLANWKDEREIIRLLRC